MLVLSRKPGQVVHIEPNITVTVLKIGEHNDIKLGFNAPKNIRIDRLEVHRQRLEILTPDPERPKP